MSIYQSCFCRTIFEPSRRSKSTITFSTSKRAGMPSPARIDPHLTRRNLPFFLCRENMPSHFKVKEYCPLVFRNLRERFGVDDVDYRESLTRSQPVQIDSSGKSGAQFYRSYDKSFILKSLTSEEIERMHAFLKHYHPVSKRPICPASMSNESATFDRSRSEQTLFFSSRYIPLSQN